MANGRRPGDASPMQRRSKAEWLELVRRYEESGQSQTKFAAENGLTLCSLGYWVRESREKPRDQTAMLPVRVVASTAPLAREPGRNRAEIEAVLPDGLRLSFPRGSRPQMIASVIARLR